MKNFKRSLALALALVMIVSAFASVSAFTLTNQQAWFADAVYDLQNWGIIGESDVDSAMSNKTIDRKTFTLWVAKILSQDVDGQIWGKGVETRYEDVNYGADNDDNSYAIAYATANGIVKGYSEGPNYTFGPDDALKLGQGAVIVIRLLSRFGDQGSISSTYLKKVQEFKDTFATTEYAAYMWWAQQKYVEVIDDTFKANCTSFADGAELTYGEAAYLIWKAATGAKTSAEYDKQGDPGTIADNLNKLDAKINRTYYGIVTEVVQNTKTESNGTVTTYDEVKSLTVQVQTSSTTYVTMTFDGTAACKAKLPTRATDNKGNTNTYTASNKSTVSKYVSVRDFTIGTMVKISYNGNAFVDAGSTGVLTYTAAADAAKVTKVETINTLVVDSFLVYRYGYTGYEGWKYNHLYDELPATSTSGQTVINKTPVLPSYYDEILAVTKSTETRKNTANTNVTVYKITFFGETYVLGTIDATTGKTMIATSLEAAATDKVIIACDAAGNEVDVANIKTAVYDQIVNIAEGQMKVTFSDTDGDADYDIITVNKNAVKFNLTGSAALNNAVADANTTSANFLFNKTVLRTGEKTADEKLVDTGTAPYATLHAANNGLTMLLMNPSEALPYYKQVALVDNVTGKAPTVVTGMVTNVETLGGIANYYKMTLVAADGTTSVVTIPAYAALNGTAITKTFKYTVGESTNTVSVNINAAGWYNYLIAGYKSQYSTGANADLFPATEANKPTWLLQRTVTVAIDEYANVLTMTGYDLLDSATEAKGFVTKVEAGANANQFKVTLAGAQATTTVDVIASLSGAYDNATLALINKIFYQKVLADNTGVTVGYVAQPENVLYVEVKNDTNNYIVAGTATNVWENAYINGDITSRIFDAKTTYTNAGLTYTTQTAILVPTVTTPEVTNYYNAYTATEYHWVVEAYPQYDANGNVISTQYAYVKTPRAIEQVQYAQVSKLVVDFTKSYTLQVVYDGATYATGATKVVVPFDVYSATGALIVNPTYAEIAAYQATTGYANFFNADGTVIPGNTVYFVDSNNIVYTILDYKGLVYKTNADGTYVVETLDATVVGSNDVTADAFAGNLTDLTPSYIASALPSNTEYKAHAKDSGYKYVPGWFRFEVKGVDTFDVKDDTVIVIATPSEARVGSLASLTYTYTETTFGALKASGKELSVDAYTAVKDDAKGYVTYLVVFGAYATAGKNSDPVVTPPTSGTVVVDTTKAIVYLPNSSLTTAYVKTGDDIYYVESSMQAINITTGVKVGTLKYYYSTWNYGADYVHQATNNVTIPAGHFYLVDLSNNAILQDLGGIFTSVTVDRLGVGPANEYSRGSINVDGTVVYANNNAHWFVKYNKLTYRTSAMNNTTYTVDVSKLAEGTNIGYFGTMKITDVTPTSIIATVGANTNVDITNLKFQFVYFDYEGDNFYVAEDQDVAHDLPTAMHDVMFQAEKADMPKVFNNGTASGVLNQWCANVIGSSKSYYYFTEPSTNFTNYVINKGWLSSLRTYLAEYTPAGMLAYFTNEYNTALTSGKSAADIDKAFAALEKCKKFYNEANEEFNDIMNDIYWTADVQNSKLYQYKVQQITSGVAESAVVYPTFTYYYDYATQTYIVFNNSIVTK